MRSHHGLIVVLPLAAMMLVQGCSSNSGFGSITAPRREGPPSAPEVVIVSRSDIAHDGMIHVLLKNRGGSTAYNVTVQSVDDACGEAAPQYSSTRTIPSTVPPNTYAEVAVPCQSFEFCMYIAGVHWDPQP
jgi:hypothetical protein